MGEKEKSINKQNNLEGIEVEKKGEIDQELERENRRGTKRTREGGKSTEKSELIEAEQQTEENEKSEDKVETKENITVTRSSNRNVVDSTKTKDENDESKLNWEDLDIGTEESDNSN